MMMGFATRCLVSAFAALVFTTCGTAATLADANPQEVRIVINAREFQPPQFTLRVGREAVLVFQNQDAEIHAFVPEGWLNHVSVTIDGDGAPIFEEDGLKRLLVPGGGRAEIRFVPRIPGQYRYRCDMPGHQMAARIVVEAEVPDSVRAQGEQQRSFVERSLQ